jgi:hypothetical protein
VLNLQPGRCFFSVFIIGNIPSALDGARRLRMLAKYSIRKRTQENNDKTIYRKGLQSFHNGSF